MIHKESVITWFRGLSGDDRIDLMCNLLDCCLPWEIRFFSTFIEAQVQRDYPAFRQPESTANNPTDLSCLTCLHDVHVRRKLCVSLALLHSSNRQAAAVMFGVLNDFQPSSLAEGEFFTDLSLLMTMSAHHPAFSFHQRHTLRAKLKQLKQSANQTSDLSETVSESSSGSSTFSFDQDVPAKFETRNNLLDGEQEAKESLDKKPSIDSEVKQVESVEDFPTVKDKSPQVYVKEIKVQAIEKIKEKKSRHDLRKRDDHRYVLQVSWCDNTTETIHRTYEEMFDFQCKLRKMYPNKVDANGNPWKLPFLPGRIRIFNKPEQKGEKTPIPDISDYTRLFSSLPKFVRGCDHVVKFFQSDKRTRKKSDSKKTKSTATKKAELIDKVKQKEFETPHKIAEAVREQSLGGKDNTKSVDTVTNKKQTQNNVSAGENSSKNNKKSTGEELSIDDLDENGNEIKLSSPEKSMENEESKEFLQSENQGKNGFIKIVPSETFSIIPLSSSPPSSLSPSSGALLSTCQASLPFKPPFSTAMQNNMLQMFTNNGLHSSVPTSLTSLHLTMPSSPAASYSSPSPSPSGSPVTSPAGSPSFPQRSCSGNINWTFRPRSHAMSVSDWLRNLRLHKYSEVFKGKTFDEMLKLSDKDFEKFGLTAGARKKLRVNLEVLRTSGCFTSNGLTIVDILPSLPSDLTPLYPANTAHSKGILMSSSFPVGTVHPPLGYNSDSEFLGSVSESDSASDCGSDLISEPGTQTGCSKIYPRKFPVLNGCRLSCYNCGSLGHVGQQCMAPNLDKKPTSYGSHFRYDGQLEC